MPSARIPNGIGKRDARNWVSNPSLGAMTWLSLRRQLKYLPMYIRHILVLVSVCRESCFKWAMCQYPQNTIVVVFGLVWFTKFQMRIDVLLDVRLCPALAVILDFPWCLVGYLIG